MELTKNQKIAIELLANSPLKEHFYWTGGTLLAAYYLHHRLSHDVDFFSDREFHFSEISYFIEALKKKAGFKDVSYQKIFDRHEFILKNTEETLRIEFVWYNHEKKAIQKKKKEYLGVFIDSLEDIAANKVMALLDRNEPKDLLDLYYILKKPQFSLIKLLKLAKQKFGMTISEATFWGECFRALKKLHRIRPLLFSDRDRREIPDKIGQFVKRHSEKFLRKILD